MFIMYKLDVCATDNIPDGFIVEDCAVYDKRLTGYSVICREYREKEILDWAQTNMGNRFPLFQKQFTHDKTIAMRFILAKLGIKSFTEELVNQSGGIEKFIEVYCNDKGKAGSSTEPVEGPVVGQELAVEPEPVTEPIEEPVVEPEPEPVEEPEPIEESMAEPEPEPMEPEEPKPVEEPEEPVAEPELVAEPKPVEEPEPVEIPEVVSELDVLSEDELLLSMQHLDTVAPSLYKAFILHEAEIAKTEDERAYASRVLNRFCGFLASLNRR